MNKFMFGLVSGFALYAGGKIISKCADKNPKMKVVKDKIVKTVRDFADDVKDVAHSVVDSFQVDVSVAEATV